MCEFLTNTKHNPDPSRTTTLRNKFAQNLRARFSKLNINIITSIVKNDIFGLKPAPIFNPQTLQVNQPIPPGGLSGETDAEKLVSFQRWLQFEIEDKILEISPVPGIQAAGTITTSLPVQAPAQFMNVFITSAYNQGRARALQEAGKAGILSADANVSSAFAQGIPANRLAHLQQQVFNELKGVTDAMSQQITRELSLGLINGDGPRTIARNITKKVNDIGKKRATLIARTETIRAHHLGNIDTLEAAGVEGVKVLAEWVTAGDDRVCPNCDALSGQIFTLKEIRGLIPLHPLCRCVAVPAGVGETVKGKERNAEDIPADELVSSDKEVQAIIDEAQKNDENFKESQKINILGNAVVKQQKSLDRIIDFVTNALDVKDKHILTNYGIAGPAGKSTIGSDGEDGDAGVEGVGISIIEHIGKDILFYMSNGTGYRLKDIIPTVRDGIDGIDAVGLKNITCNKKNEVIIELTDGSSKTIGKFKNGTDGEDGDNGVGIKNTFIQNQDLFIELSDGKTINTGQILNTQEVVDQLMELLEPVSVTDVDVNELGLLIIQLSNGESINAGRVVGKTPDHQIDQGRRAIRFKKPSGIWGKWLLLGRRSGGGGISDHDKLENLNWLEAGHTGEANKFAGFDSEGNATFLEAGTGTGLMPYRASEIPNDGLIPEGFAIIACGEFELDGPINLQGRFCL